MLREVAVHRVEVLGKQLERWREAPELRELAECVVAERAIIGQPGIDSERGSFEPDDQAAQLAEAMFG